MLVGSHENWDSITPVPKDAAAGTAFTASDHAWEQVQESGLRAFAAGGAGFAAEHWRRGLSIARDHFAPSDPRRATSLTNVGLVLRRGGDRCAAATHFEEARAVWDRAPGWVRLMRPLNHADDVYDECAIRAFDALIARGRAASVAIERLGLLPAGNLEQWQKERPRRGSDLRKLLGAVLLIASRPH